MELSDHLFRQESGRITAVLTRLFGFHNLDLVEDVVQDAFCQAMETWRFRGLPDNPSAWLMAVAKRKAIDTLRHKKTVRTFADDLSRWLKSEWTLTSQVNELFEPDAIQDEMLRTMFACCHPTLAEPAQVMLILHILCGFSVNETAAAFLNSHAAAEKRIGRAKKLLAEHHHLFDIHSPVELSERLPAVERALYLLFNEGYHGASEYYPIRDDLCREATRLCTLLFQQPGAAGRQTYALGSLMYLTAARLPARTDAQGNLQTLFEQDRALWDQGLLAKGFELLERSAGGEQLSAYHLEAAIAAIHSKASSVSDTDWKQIVTLYDALLLIKRSPVVALNRAIAIGQNEGPERGLEAIDSIDDRKKLAAYPFYFAAMGELELRRSQPAVAADHFRAALALARNPMERRFLEQRVNTCN